MSDVVERLRSEWADWRVGDCVAEAADEIERLRAENERLREALHRTSSIAESFGAAFGLRLSDYAQGYSDACDTICMTLKDFVARAALGEENKP